MPYDHDSSLRAAIHRRLLWKARQCSETLIVDELGVQHGASRVDIAVINGHIRGIEIKARADSLKRLEPQVDSYSRVVDKAVLVADTSHVEIAAVRLPHWWGLIEARRTKDGVTFHRLVSEKQNPQVDPYALASLLWREEALHTLREKGVDRHLARAPRKIIYQALVDSMSLQQLKAIVRERLKSRADWRRLEPVS